MKNLKYKLLTLFLILAFVETLSFFFHQRLIAEKTDQFTGTFLTAKEGDSYKTFAHPYFGYINEGEWKREREGYPHEVIHVGSEFNSFLRVGLFGGSVMDDLFKYFQKHPLKSICEERGVSLINLSLRGGKQPQQFHRALHYMDDFDIAINLEGVNEILIDAGKDFPIDYPLFSNLLFPMNPENIREVRFWEWLIFSSKTLYSFWNQYPLQTPKFILKSLNKFAVEKVRGKFLRKGRNEGAQKIQNWVKFSTSQQKLLEALNKPMFLFLQPLPRISKIPSHFFESKKDKTEKEDKKLTLVKKSYKQFVANNSFNKWIDLNDSDYVWSKGARIKDLYGHLNEEGLKSLGEKVLSQVSKYCLKRDQ